VARGKHASPFVGGRPVCLPPARDGEPGLPRAPGPGAQPRHLRGVGPEALPAGDIARRHTDLVHQEANLHVRLRRDKVTRPEYAADQHRSLVPVRRSAEPRHTFGTEPGDLQIRGGLEGFPSSGLCPIEPGRRRQARVYDGDQLLTEVTRNTTKPIARFKARKPEPTRRSSAPRRRPTSDDGTGRRSPVRLV
jgi:hypothetical protein